MLDGTIMSARVSLEYGRLQPNTAPQVLKNSGSPTCAFKMSSWPTAYMAAWRTSLLSKGALSWLKRYMG
ncbi:hypothetical protein D3C71_1781210 [compost metagenome]